ncbi:AMP-binding protein [Streptomyces sp. NPDC088733]|uniref:AMP-binding protein n=1 Tax=Streptomyces sp. NPDC088733 TaxID=3365880 RepID=UPI0037F57053
MSTARPGRARTAYDWLTRHATSRPSATAVTAWRDGAIRETIDYAGLTALVERAAAALAAQAPDAGDRVVLALPNDHTFTAALLACAAAGLIAVPAPPLTADAHPAALARLRGIVEDCRPALVLSRAGQARDGDTAAIAGLRRVVAWDDLIASAGVPSGPPRPARQCAVALLQYTSGSTGAPKGAVITHRALRASCAQAARIYGESPHDTSVTWVPLHHDMGLVTGVLRPLFSGYASVLLHPREFARSPLSWLRALTAVRGSMSSAPDFAYALCVRRVSAEQVRQLDLTAWRIARNAGEVVRADTAERFAAHFAPAGFRPDAFCPSYGMAEATLTVTTGTPDDPALRLAVDRAALQAGQVVPSTEAGGSRSVLLSSGRPLPGTQVEISDHEGRTGRHAVVGRIRIRGPQMFSGYWPSAASRAGTADAAHDRDAVEDWHSTGDLGFVHRGHLFVLGRGDDTVVQNGRNFYAADIRAVCAGIPGVRPGRCVAFTTGGLGSDAPGTARVCLVTEVDASAAVRASLAQEIRGRLAVELELFVHDVELLGPGQLSLTTSGKPQVSETRNRRESRASGVRDTCGRPTGIADGTPPGPGPPGPTSKE